MATVTNRAGLRSSRLRTQLAAVVSAVRARRTTDVAPTTSSFLRWRSPIFEMRPSLSLPPDEFWRGTRPSEAENSRPERNAVGSVTEAARAVALMTPTPGMVVNR